MELQLVPLDNETGEVLQLNPEMLKKFDNSTLTNLLSATKGIDKLKKEAEKEVKKRLDEGQLFSRLSYSKQQYTRVLAMDNAAKMALIRKYGLDSVVPLTINQLEKKYGESVYEDIQPYIVENERSRSIIWDA